MARATEVADWSTADVAQGGDRRDPAGPEGRGQRREHGDGQADDEGGDDRAGRDDQLARRDVEADGTEQGTEPHRHAARRRRGRSPKRRCPPASDSSRMPISSWRRLAPIARSIAMSFFRWATMIENVL